MNIESEPMPLDPLRKAARRKVSFDPTINLGHVLTFVGFLATGTVAYFDLRERIALAEAKTSMQQEKLLEIRQDMREVREDMRETRKGVNDLLQRKDK